MDFKFSKDSDDIQEHEASGEKKKQSALLALLLILVGGFTYVYFFTGLIKPQESQKTADAPAPVAQIVKIPLPAREGEPAKPAEKVPAGSEEQKIPNATPEAVKIPAAKPVISPAKPSAASAAPTSSTPTEESKKTEAAVHPGKQPLPMRAADKKGAAGAVAKSEPKKPAAETKKPAVAENKITAAAPAVKKPVPAGHATAKPVVKNSRVVPETWSLIVGNYVLEEALSSDMGRVRKAGFKPVVKPSERKKTTMNRLFVSEYKDRATAQSTMGMLKRYTSDVFIIEQGGRFAVYAGSYLQNEAANSEIERLRTAGITATLRQVTIAIPSQSLSIGPFKNKKDADAARSRLKNAGIKSIVSQK